MKSPTSPRSRIGRFSAAFACMSLVATVAVGCAGASPEGDADDEAVLDTSEDSLASCPKASSFAQFSCPAKWEKDAKPEDCTCVSSRYDCMAPNPQHSMNGNANRARFLNAKRTNAGVLDGTWPIAAGVGVYDGRHQHIGTTSATAALLNYGQKKRMFGRTYVFVKVIQIAEGQGAPGWVDAACVGWDGTTTPASSCETNAAGADTKLYADVPSVTARRPPLANQKHTRVSEFRAELPPELANLNPDDLKVVCNWTGPNSAAGDYFAKPRAGGKLRAVHLNFTLPGREPHLSGLAGDTFIVGHVEGSQVVSNHVSFHRLLDVDPVSVKLYKESSAEPYSSEDPHVSFVYGYVNYERTQGVWAKRFGWVPVRALVQPEEK